ncbi:hypothetical protein Q9233_001461 [Columba guinea]|nr:hypothetical protein Q9233_001461 [Columba guinea]
MDAEGMTRPLTCRVFVQAGVVFNATSEQVVGFWVSGYWKLSNPDIFASAGKTKLHRQLSQDDCKLRRGKQLLPLSNSVHSGVGQPIWQPPGDTSNLVRMRNQSLGQSAPSLTAGLVAFNHKRLRFHSLSLLATGKSGELDVLLFCISPGYRKEWLAGYRFGFVGEMNLGNSLQMNGCLFGVGMCVALALSRRNGTIFGDLSKHFSVSWKPSDYVDSLIMVVE